MALSDQTSAYSDCYDFFDRAIRSGRGIRILVPSEKDASFLRFRLNQSRVLQRRESTRVYQRTDPQYGKCEFDKFRVTTRPPADGETGFWVYIEEWSAETLDVEEL